MRGGMRVRRSERGCSTCCRIVRRSWSGKELGEDLSQVGAGKDELPASGNDEGHEDLRDGGTGMWGR